MSGIFAEVEEKGRKEGLQEGIQKGRQEGLQEGHQEGFEEGCVKTKVEMVRNLMKAQGWSLEKTFTILDLPKEERISLTPLI